MNRPPPEGQAPSLNTVLALNDAGARLTRGREHLAKLEELLKPGPNADQNRVLVDYKQELGCHLVYVEIAELPSHEAVPVAIDALHEFRCVLDYIAWQLVLRERKGVEPSEQEARDIAFPICDDPRRLTGMQVMGYVGKDAAKELRLHQPHMPSLGAPHDPALLSPLRDLDNFSKHRLLMVRGHSFGSGDFPFRFDPPITRMRTASVPQAQSSPYHGGFPLRHPLLFLYADPATGDTADLKVEIDPQPTFRPVMEGFGVEIDLDRLKATADCVEFILKRRIQRRFFPLVPQPK